jgi:hypothetical protein
MYLGRRKTVPQTLEDWDRILSEPDIHDRGNYLSHIPRWEAELPRDAILYIPFGRIAHSPLAVLREIEDFCRLPSATYPKATEVVFKGPDVHFPEEVVERMREQQEGQTLFLKARFGADFLEESRGVPA